MEALCSSKSPGTSKVTWSDSSLASFKKAQLALKDAKSITLPTQDDILWIVTDALLSPGALGATLYIIRNSQTLLGGFFNAKLPPFQQRWLPCEIEGVGISLALKHFAPLIIQSSHKPCILTDSKA